MITYRLDPDFSRVAPSDGPYCACCQKPIRDVASAVKVTVNWENKEVAEGHDVALPRRSSSGKVIDNALIGKTCWRKLKIRRWE
jgi:hypothetical protein